MCGRADCTTKVRGRTYCEEHASAPWSGSQRSADTSTAAWRRLRLAVLERDDHRCQLGWRGCLGDATECDHITPVYEWPNQPLDDLSLYQAACRSCHAKRSGSQGGRAAAASRRSTG